MNIFIILIMSVMFGMYQYFTAKRSSDVVLNKEEQTFQVELNCLKQYHDFAAAKNETLPNATQITATYNCAGKENIQSQKYCISGVNTIINCTDSNADKHCVATTMKRALTKEQNYLKSLIFKKGIYEIQGGKINGTIVTPTQVSDNFGLSTCVPAEKLTEQKKLAGEDCAKQGKFATLSDSGNYECVDVPEVTACTAHEDELINKGGRANCIDGVNGKFCCAKSATGICGTDANIQPVWNAATRFYKCTNGNDECSKSINMIVTDEKGMPIKTPSGGTLSSVSISGTKLPYIAKYDTDKKKWDCMPNSANLVEACRKAGAENNYAYSSVSNLSINDGIPKCNLTSSESASAIENCSVCGFAALQNNQWACQYKRTLPDLLSVPGLVDKLRGDANFTNTKGVKSCFSSCTPAMMAKIKTGIKNEEDWGLIWREDTKIWECFACQDSFTYINSACTYDPDLDEVTSCTQTTNGICTLKNCNELYQKRATDGRCYTKWCVEIPSEVGASIGKPTTRDCPTSHPRMLYNSQKDCVYCIRPPVDRVD